MATGTSDGDDWGKEDASLQCTGPRGSCSTGKCQQFSGSTAAVSTLATIPFSVIATVSRGLLKSGRLAPAFGSPWVNSDGRRLQIGSFLSVLGFSFGPSLIAGVAKPISESVESCNVHHQAPPFLRVSICQPVPQFLSMLLPLG